METTKTFKAVFTNICQKPGETVEEYATELKRLYDKAFPQRDGETRREDLLRNFSMVWLTKELHVDFK